MKQQTMVAMMTTKRRMEEAMPAKVVGLQGRKEKRKLYAICCGGVSVRLTDVTLKDTD